MRIIAFMNQKGGVGKTTTAANVGAALAEAGKTVCLMDMDPQAHLTINFGVDPAADGANLYDVLVHGKAVSDALRPLSDRVSLIPSSIDLAAAEIELVAVLGRELILKRRLEASTLDFDYLLMDCPPSLGLLTINALAVADEVIVPMQAHFLALQGVGKLLETVALVRKRMNPKLKVSGIVLTMFDAQTKLSGEVIGDLESFLESARGQGQAWSDAVIFQTRIRRNIKLAEAPSFGQSVLKYETGSHGAKDYRTLAGEILKLHEQGAGTAVGRGAGSVSAMSDTMQVASSPVLSVPTPAVAVTVNSAISAAHLKAAQVGRELAAGQQAAHGTESAEPLSAKSGGKR